LRARLASGNPAIHCRLIGGALAFSPLAIGDAAIPAIAAALSH
jgi:hypothetical protein